MLRHINSDIEINGSAVGRALAAVHNVTVTGATTLVAPTRQETAIRIAMNATATVTLAAPTQTTLPHRLTLVFTQGTGGSRLLTLAGPWWTPEMVPIRLSLAAGAVDQCVFEWISGAWRLQYMARGDGLDWRSVWVSFRAGEANIAAGGNTFMGHASAVPVGYRRCTGFHSSVFHSLATTLATGESLRILLGQSWGGNGLGSTSISIPTGPTPTSTDASRRYYDSGLVAVAHNIPPVEGGLATPLANLIMALLQNNTGATINGAAALVQIRFSP